MIQLKKINFFFQFLFYNITMKKIAFMFLIIDNPNFSDIWDKYLKNNDDRYTIYIHPKYPEKHTWRPNNIISNIKETAWGFITEAYLELFKEAYKDKENYKFITISESCIPIKTFDVFYKEMMKDNKSWIKKMEIKKWDLNERLLKYIENIKKDDIQKYEIKKIFKHYARFCLNREHANQLIELNKKNKLNFFHKMHVADEFFLSSLYPLSNYHDFIIIYDDWDFVLDEIKYINKLIKNCYEIQEKKNIDMKKDITHLKELKNQLSKNPKTLIDVVPDLNKIIHCSSFFYRKLYILSKNRIVAWN